MTFNKTPPWRSKKYCDWIKSINDPLFGGGDNHHIIQKGLGGGATKASDLFQMAMSRQNHTELHHDPKKWEAMHGDQWIYVIGTIQFAIDNAVLTNEFVVAEIKSQVKNQDHLEMLLGVFENKLDQ